MRRSACRRPLRGGTTCSMRSVNSTAPTRSLLRTADIASTAASSVASSLLNRRTRAEPLRAREVDGEHDRELALLDVALHERPPHARRDVPVDRAHLVAGLVLAHLGELHPLPLEHGAVLAGEERVHEPARAELDELDLPEDFGGRRADRDAPAAQPLAGADSSLAAVATARRRARAARRRPARRRCVTGSRSSPGRAHDRRRS